MSNKPFGVAAFPGVPVPGRPKSRVLRVSDLKFADPLSGLVTPGATVPVCWRAITAPDGTTSLRWPLAGQLFGIPKLLRYSVAGMALDFPTSDNDAFGVAFHTAMAPYQDATRAVKLYQTDCNGGLNGTFLGRTAFGPGGNDIGFNEEERVVPIIAEEGFLGVDVLNVITLTLADAGVYFEMPSVTAMFGPGAGGPQADPTDYSQYLRAWLGNFRRYGLWFYVVDDPPDDPDFFVYGSTPPDVLKYADVVAEFQAGCATLAGQLADCNCVLKGTISVRGGDPSVIVNDVLTYFGFR